MSNLRLVMRGECEPAAAGCSRASDQGPGCAVLPHPGELGLSSPLFGFFCTGSAALPRPSAGGCGKGVVSGVFEVLKPGWTQLCCVGGQHGTGTAW